MLDNDEDAQAYVGPATRVVDLHGRFVVPGFIDGHTYFDAAGAMVNGVNPS